MSTIAKIVLDTRRKAANGYPIKIQVYNGKTKYIHLNHYAHENEWNGTNVNKKHPNHRSLHTSLNTRALKLIDQVNYCNDNSLDLEMAIKIIKFGISDMEVAVLREKVRSLENVAKTTLFDFFDIRISEKEKIGESTYAYTETKKQIKKYLVHDINMNDVTYELVNGFVNHKLANGCERGGVNFYLTTLRATYKESQRRRSLMVKPDNPFLGLIRKSATKPVIKLPDDVIERLMCHGRGKFQNKESMEITRRNIDIFMLQFYLGGQDYVDVSLLEWKDYKDGRIVFTRHKNRNRESVLISVKVFDVAKEIIEKYATPGGRLFKFIPDKRISYKKYKYFVDNVNRSLATVSMNLDLPRLSTKKTRYFFRSRAGEMGINVLAVMQIQGHSPRDSEMTFVYQSRLPDAIVDRAHKRIITF